MTSASMQSVRLPWCLGSFPTLLFIYVLLFFMLAFTAISYRAWFHTSRLERFGGGGVIPFLMSHLCHKMKTEHRSARHGTHTGWWVGTAIKDGHFMKSAPNYWFPSAVLLPSSKLSSCNTFLRMLPCPSMEPTLTVLPVSGCGSHSGAPPCRLSVGGPVFGWHGLLVAPQLVGTYLFPGVGFPRSSWHNEKQKPR